MPMAYLFKNGMEECEFELMKRKPNENEMVWFAMAAPYRRELKAVEQLKDHGVDCFVPMRWEVIDKGNVKKKKKVPAISNLLFVHDTRAHMKELKKVIPIIQYHTQPTSTGAREVVIVPKAQMEHFMKICTSEDHGLRYLTLDEIQRKLKPGSHVRIIGGAFNGVEGYYITIKGVRNRRLVVTIPDLVAASVEVTPDVVEVIEEEKP